MLNLRNNSADSVLFRLVSSFGNLDLRLFAIWPGEKKGEVGVSIAEILDE